MEKPENSLRGKENENIFRKNKLNLINYQNIKAWEKTFVRLILKETEKVLKGRT